MNPRSTRDGMCGAGEMRGREKSVWVHWPSTEQKEVEGGWNVAWGWSRRRCAEDEAFEGRQGLLCLLQEAGRYLKGSRKPLQSFEQGRQDQLRI